MSDTDTVTTEWKSIESEDVDQEGFIIIPAKGDANQYAMAGPNALFDTFDKAQKIYEMMISKGVAGIGDVKIVRARLSHHRKVDVETSVEETATPRLVVVK